MSRIYVTHINRILNKNLNEEEVIHISATFRWRRFNRAASELTSMLSSRHGIARNGFPCFSEESRVFEAV
jgi:hypothetical protein